jgi:hypothetical protein
MANKREFDGTQRTRGDSGSTNAEPAGNQANTSDLGRLAKGKAIQVVSEPLSAKKVAFDITPASSLSPLPKITNSIGDIANHLKSSSNF